MSRRNENRWGWLAALALAALLAIVILSSIGCSVSFTTSTSTDPIASIYDPICAEDQYPQGFPERQLRRHKATSISVGLLSDSPSVAETATSKASSGGTHPPDPEVERARLMTRTGLWLFVIGALLFTLSFHPKLKMIPTGASAGVACIGIAVLLLGWFFSFLADNPFVAIGAIAICVIIEVLGGFGNWRQDALNLVRTRKPTEGTEA